MEQPRNTIESHSSYLTNRSITAWFQLIDYLGFAAANSLRFRDINSYYNALEQIYLGRIVKILPDDTVEEIEKIRVSYNKLLSFLEQNPKARSMGALKLLLEFAKKFNFCVAGGLQDREFFFRMGSKQQKGLGKIKFFNSIFNTGKKDGTKEGKTQD